MSWNVFRGAEDVQLGCPHAVDVQMQVHSVQSSWHIDMVGLWQVHVHNTCIM